MKAHGSLPHGFRTSFQSEHQGFPLPNNYSYKMQNEGAGVFHSDLWEWKKQRERDREWQDGTFCSSSPGCLFWGCATSSSDCLLTLHYVTLKTFFFSTLVCSVPVSENQSHTSTVLEQATRSIFALSCWQRCNLDFICKFLFLFSLRFYNTV